MCDVVVEKLWMGLRQVALVVVVVVYSHLPPAILISVLEFHCIPSAVEELEEALVVWTLVGVLDLTLLVGPLQTHHVIR
jgi:hypothetical protein